MTDLCTCNWSEYIAPLEISLNDPEIATNFYEFENDLFTVNIERKREYGCVVIVGGTTTGIAKLGTMIAAHNMTVILENQVKFCAEIKEDKDDYIKDYYKNTEPTVFKIESLEQYHLHNIELSDYPAYVPELDRFKKNRRKVKKRDKYANL